MVKTGGTILGEAANPQLLPEKDKMVKNIMKSCWPAVSQPDPFNPYAEPFVADAVIANPPCMGHIHVCEALAIPLHIMFPQPWYYKTKSFPHPMSGLNYEESADDTLAARANSSSYYAFEALVFTTLSLEINSWRAKVLRLPPIPLGPTFVNLVADTNIPFSAMWSPSFVPKPEDWPKQCRVVGTFTQDKKKACVVDEEKFADLIQWLNAGPKPVFIGFGSMVISDTNRLQGMIMKAARITNTRIVVQSSWSKMDVSSESLCHNVGPVAHDWLLPQCCAVVHHGGAGTTAAGLRYGLPNLVCPFFGDQYMWGAMVHRAGVGPKPCPVDKLTSTILIEKLTELTSATITQKATELSQNMGKENGVVSGLEHFCDSLPVDNMMCDVSLIMGESTIAKYALSRNRIHISHEVASGLATRKAAGDRIIPTCNARFCRRFQTCWTSPLNPDQNEEFLSHSKTAYALGGNESDYVRGMIGACCESSRIALEGLLQICLRPDTMARSSGAIGCICGLLLSPIYTFLYLFRSLIVCIDRTVTSYANGCFGKKWAYFIDYRNHVHIPHDPLEENGVYYDETMDKTRRKNIKEALKFVKAALAVFNNARPTASEENWHFVEAETHALLLSVDGKGKSKLDLSTEEHGTLVRRLTSYKKDRDGTGDPCISFSRFCLYLGEAVHARFLGDDKHKRNTLSSNRPEMPGSFRKSMRQMQQQSDIEAGDSPPPPADEELISGNSEYVTVTVPMSFDEEINEASA